MPWNYQHSGTYRPPGRNTRESFQLRQLKYMGSRYNHLLGKARWKNSMKFYRWHRFRKRFIHDRASGYRANMIASILRLNEGIDRWRQRRRDAARYRAWMARNRRLTTYYLKKRRYKRRRRLDIGAVQARNQELENKRRLDAIPVRNEEIQHFQDQMEVARAAARNANNVNDLVVYDDDGMPGLVAHSGDKRPREE